MMKSVLATATAVGGIAYGAKKLYDQFRGTIVIGPKGSGKTTLAHLLAKKELDGIGTTTTKNKIGDYIFDFPGDEHCVGTEWNEAIEKDPHYCMYVFNLENYNNDIVYEGYSYRQLVLWHINLIYDWNNRMNICVIGTHDDCVDNQIPNQISNDIKSELKKRGKEVTVKVCNLLSMDFDKLTTLIEG